MSWFSMLDSDSGSDADVEVEGRGPQSWPKKLTLWEGMQPDVPAIVEVVWWERQRMVTVLLEVLTILLKLNRWRVVSRPRLME